MTTVANNHKQTLVTCLILFLLAFVSYYPVLDNFFTWDDFLWLQRAKNLAVNPLQMFNLDSLYFDPLVYIWFWLEYHLYGLNYFWFHFADISVHALNGLLVYLLVYSLSQVRLAAFSSSVFFITSFAVVDTVAWSSSRVDLLAVFFSLLTLLCLLKHLESGAKTFLYLSITAFICALCAKGTPLLLPALLTLIICLRSEITKQWRLLLPFIVVAGGYLILLGFRLVSVDRSFLARTGGGLNFHNLALSFAELFVPEIHLATLSVGLVAVGLVICIALCFYFIEGPYRQTAMLGLALMAVGLAPMLILKDFRMVTSIHDAGHLLNSPSHRIYLASVGSACFCGALLASCSARLQKRWLIYTLLPLIIVYSLYEIRLREDLWSGSARYIRASVEGIASYRNQLLDNSAIGLVNFPMSRGFMRPALALYCGLEQVLLLPMSSIPSEILDSQEIFRYRKRGFFFVFADNRVINLSSSFDRLLDVAFFYQVSVAPQERDRLLAEYSVIATQINSVIDSAVERSPLGLDKQKI